MTLDVRAAGAGLSASDRPADAVGLHGVRRKLVMRLATKLEGAQQGRSALWCGRTPRSRLCTGASTGGAETETHLATPFPALGAAREVGQRLATAYQRRSAFVGEDVPHASSAGSADPAAIGLVAELMRESDVVRSVLAALTPCDRPAIGGGRPRSIPRRSPAVEARTPIRAGADRHLALQRGDPPRLDGLDQHDDVVIARLTIIPQPAQRASELASVHPWSIGVIGR